MQAVNDLPVCVRAFRNYERIYTDFSKSQQDELSVTILMWRMARILVVADIIHVAIRYERTLHSHYGGQEEHGD